MSFYRNKRLWVDNNVKFAPERFRADTWVVGRYYRETSLTKVLGPQPLWFSRGVALSENHILIFFEDVYRSICAIFLYVVDIYERHLGKNQHPPPPIIASQNTLLKVSLIFLIWLMASYNFEIMFFRCILDSFITYIFFKILARVRHSQNLKKLEIRG